MESAPRSPRLYPRLCPLLHTSERIVPRETGGPSLHGQGHVGPGVNTRSDPLLRNVTQNKPRTSPLSFEAGPPANRLLGCKQGHRRADLWLRRASQSEKPAQRGAVTGQAGARAARARLCAGLFLNEAEPPPSLAEERPLTTPKPTEPGRGQGGRGQEGEEKAPTPAHAEPSTSARDARPRAARVGLADVRPREPGRRLLQARPAPERRPPAGARGELTPSSCPPPHMWACRQALQP